MALEDQVNRILHTVLLVVFNFDELTVLLHKVGLVTLLRVEFFEQFGDFIFVFFISLLNSLLSQNLSPGLDFTLSFSVCRINLHLNVSNGFPAFIDSH